MIDDPNTETLLQAYDKLVDQEGWIQHEIQAQLRLASAPHVVGNRLQVGTRKNTAKRLKLRLEEVSIALFLLEGQLWEIDTKREQARRRMSDS
jgi:hypothetical protein